MYIYTYTYAQIRTGNAWGLWNRNKASYRALFEGRRSIYRGGAGIPRLRNSSIKRVRLRLYCKLVGLVTLFERLATRLVRPAKLGARGSDYPEPPRRDSGWYSAAFGQALRDPVEPCGKHGPYQGPSRSVSRITWLRVVHPDRYQDSLWRSIVLGFHVDSIMNQGLVWRSVKTEANVDT